MEKEKNHYGLTIKQLVDEKNLKISKIFAQLGFAHRNGVYMSFNRKDFDLSELDNWAQVLGVTRQEIIERTEGSNVESKDAELPVENKYLIDILAYIEKINTNLLLRVEEQSKTIQEQSHTINMLVQKQLGVNFKTVTAVSSPAKIVKLGLLPNQKMIA
jgi:hypothetical protein